MSKAPKRRTNTGTASVAQRTTSATNTAAKKSNFFSHKENGTLLFGKRNYMILLYSVGLIALGMLLMIGGRQAPDQWDENVIYSTRTTIIAPFFILAGLFMTIWAIFAKSNTAQTDYLQDSKEQI